MSTTAAEVTVSAAAATAVATKCHMFKIEGFKRIKTMYGNGRSIDSCGFEAAGRTWRIQFFPDGNRVENAGFVSLVLKLDDNDDANAAAAGNDDVLVEFRFSLVCHPDKPASRAYSKTCTTTFNKKARKALGCCQFIRRDELERSDYLRDDCLAVRCDIAVVNNPVDVKEQAAKAHDLERLGVVCDCKDDACKSHHLRVALSFREALVKLFLGCFHL
ncbi:BTB/POZ and MATH domain-containing protein 4-like [Panicum miliaceum]|uniref:BTB/POZ and MATH domain-containing protein 4-like n=1 Tax=Panicum miliaceum TaxID=4540 RepID=A0A3L6RHZ7_PANMI|nr:BTB/POZ and MATH domain-containing protein 4-like [Panicum miliaceum]